MCTYVTRQRFSFGTPTSRFDGNLVDTVASISEFLSICCRSWTTARGGETSTVNFGKMAVAHKHCTVKNFRDTQFSAHAPQSSRSNLVHSLLTPFAAADIFCRDDILLPSHGRTEQRAERWRRRERPRGTEAQKTLNAIRSHTNTHRQTHIHDRVSLLQHYTTACIHTCDGSLL